MLHSLWQAQAERQPDAVPPHAGSHDQARGQGGGDKDKDQEPERERDPDTSRRGEGLNVHHFGHGLNPFHHHHDGDVQGGEGSSGRGEAEGEGRVSGSGSEGVGSGTTTTGKETDVQSKPVPVGTKVHHHGLFCHDHEGRTATATTPTTTSTSNPPQTESGTSTPNDGTTTKHHRDHSLPQLESRPVSDVPGMVGNANDEEGKQQGVTKSGDGNGWGTSFFHPHHHHDDGPRDPETADPPGPGIKDPKDDVTSADSRVGPTSSAPPSSNPGTQTQTQQDAVPFWMNLFFSADSFEAGAASKIYSPRPVPPPSQPSHPPPPATSTPVPTTKTEKDVTDAKRDHELELKREREEREEKKKRDEILDHQLTVGAVAFMATKIYIDRKREKERERERQRGREKEGKGGAGKGKEDGNDDDEAWDLVKEVLAALVAMEIDKLYEEYNLDVKGREEEKEVVKREATEKAQKAIRDNWSMFKVFKHDRGGNGDEGGNRLGESHDSPGTSQVRNPATETAK